MVGSPVVGSSESLSDGKSRDAHARSLLSDESGATMVLGVFMAAMAVGVLYYLHGVANVVVHRERMQDAADSAAFMSAVVSARCMNILAILNMIMGALAVVGAAMRIAADIVTGAAVAAGIACALCRPCTPCIDAIRHGLDARRAHRIARDVERVVDDMISVVHGVAVFVRDFAPMLIAQPRVITYGTHDYAPTTDLGIPWPIGDTLQAEEDDSNWPCENRVEWPPAHGLGVVASAFMTHMSGFYVASAAVTPFLTRRMRASRYCGSYDSFQRVTGGAWLGEREFQLQAYMHGQPRFRFTRGGVRVASWGREATNVSDSLEFANEISFAQAEYYFEDDDGMRREEWLWHCQWRARMRRFRLGDALPPGLGGFAGMVDTLSSLVAH